MLLGEAPAWHWYDCHLCQDPEIQLAAKTLPLRLNVFMIIVIRITWNYQSAWQPSSQEQLNNCVSVRLDSVWLCEIICLDTERKHPNNAESVGPGMPCEAWYLLCCSSSVVECFNPRTDTFMFVVVIALRWLELVWCALCTAMQHSMTISERKISS